MRRGVLQFKADTLSILFSSSGGFNSEGLCAYNFFVVYCAKHFYYVGLAVNFSFILGIGICKPGKPEIYFLDTSGVAVPKSLSTLSTAAIHFKITCAVFASGERSEAVQEQGDTQILYEQAQTCLS